ncbi:unnamed protein product [Adineta ricciae]|uniref:Uncharacterized protein n=1 Tax=Adineta ricciae TaxID=249248 RepID=A0A814G9N0_ADIRI|nr:unnamed protein product [Adineta ricciae]
MTKLFLQSDEDLQITKCRRCKKQIIALKIDYIHTRINDILLYIFISYYVTRRPLIIHLAMMRFSFVSLMNLPDVCNSALLNVS